MSTWDWAACSWTSWSQREGLSWSKSSENWRFSWIPRRPVLDESLMRPRYSHLPCFFFSLLSVGLCSSLGSGTMSSQEGLSMWLLILRLWQEKLWSDETSAHPEHLTMCINPVSQSIEGNVKCYKNKWAICRNGLLQAKTFGKLSRTMEQAPEVLQDFSEPLIGHQHCAPLRGQQGTLLDWGISSSFSLSFFSPPESLRSECDKEKHAV